MMILATGKNSGFTPSEISSFKCSKRFRTGFTLVEIMISIAILSMGLILILQGFTNSLNILRIAEHNLETSLLAEEKMVEMEINVKQDKQIPDKYLSGESQSDNIGFLQELQSRQPCRKEHGHRKDTRYPVHHGAGRHHFRHLLGVLPGPTVLLRPETCIACTGPGSCCGRVYPHNQPAGIQTRRLHAQDGCDDLGFPADGYPGHQ